MNYASYDDVLQIVQGVAKKVPQGILQGNTPIGTIISYMGNTPPEDYLACDGSVISIISYKELADFFEVQFGSCNYFGGDGTTTFAVPDLRGEFLRGTGINSHANQGSGTTVGTHQNATSFPVIGVYNIDGSSGSGVRIDARFNTANNTATIPNNFDTTITLSGNTAKYMISNSNSTYSMTDNTFSNYTSRPTNTSILYCIKYRTSTSVFNTINAGRFTATAPAHYEREQLFTTNKTTITIYPTWVNLDNIGFVLEGTRTIDINNSSNWDTASYATASNRAGHDFYIYAVYNSPNNIEPEFILSANSTIPTGYTANTSRKVGGFHCLCLSVGTISGHTLSGYVTGDILPQSAWDLKHRAVAENEGMVWIPQIGLWADIYLGSWNGSKLVSAYNGVPVTGTSTKAMHGIMMAEEYGLVNKCLPSYDNFIVAAKGTPEGSHISTDAAPTGAGGHIDKSSRRIISNCGLEDCCGVLWQWGKDHCETYFNNTNNGTTYNGAFYNSSSGQYWLQGMAWNDNPVYNSTVDSVKRGSCAGLLRRLLFGGYYGNAVAACGSRAVGANYFGAPLNADIGGRGFSKVR